MGKQMSDCTQNYIKQFLDIESDIDDAINNPDCPLPSRMKGRIALMGFSDEDSFIIEDVIADVYERLSSIEYMVDSFNVEYPEETMHLLKKEGEIIYRDEPLALMLIISRIDDIMHTDAILSAINFARKFSCQEIYGVFLVDDDLEDDFYPHTFPQMQITSIRTDEIRQSSDLCVLKRKIPNEDLALSLYTAALTSIRDFLKKQHLSGDER